MKTELRKEGRISTVPPFPGPKGVRKTGAYCQLCQSTGAKKGEDGQEAIKRGNKMYPLDDGEG